ncbi:zinc-binding dehydrogenase [Actinoplanes sp. LDG1-01]|uniref:Zinc-binding dehydrogenase n=1 Tax=Paractinoplanes lichenicola TaxID=2802976 RepID=A0ABS1VM80_9ACTN|nr:zinc-binding dehydrogenase [Actinoplanes lichenicola]
MGAQAGRDAVGAGQGGGLRGRDGHPGPRPARPAARHDVAGARRGHGLSTAAELVTAGRFRVPIEAVFPVREAARAHQAVTSGSRRGKIVLDLD